MSHQPFGSQLGHSMFYEIVIESIATGIVTINMDGVVLSINKAGQEIFGVSKEDAIGSSFLFGLASPERARLKRTIDYVIRTGNPFCGNEITTINRIGRTIYINTYVSLFHDNGGEKLGVVMLTEDITEKGKMEEEYRLADKLATMGEMALGVAHEIRNPLGSIKGLASLAKSEMIDQDKRIKYLDVIIKEVDRLERVSQELLDFARRQNLESKPVNINEVINEVLFLCELNASLYNITLTKNLQERLPLIYGDEQKLRQAFINLARNAVQAIGEHGSIKIESLLDGDWVVVKVSDSGVGIPSSVLHKIFDPYYSTKESGTGLGLSVVHQIIAGHGGRIEVDSEISVGTTFTVKLPVEGGLRILERKANGSDS